MAWKITDSKIRGKNYCYVTIARTEDDKIVEGPFTAREKIDSADFENNIKRDLAIKIRDTRKRIKQASLKSKNISLENMEDLIDYEIPKVAEMETQ